MKPRKSTVAVLLILGFSGLFAPQQASAEWVLAKWIYFDSMVVLDDKEGGCGDWWLTVDFGRGEYRYNWPPPFETPPATTLINDWEAGTGETLIIDRWMFVGAPPHLRFTVWEHDGGFWPSWEYVGEEMGALPDWSGLHSVNIENNEGKVRIWYRVYNYWHWLN